MRYYLTRFSLEGQVSVVTGGANGIGAVLAGALADAGSDVAVVDIDLDQGQAVADRLAEEHEVRARAWELNAAEREAVLLVLEAAGGVEAIALGWGSPRHDSGPDGAPRTLRVRAPFGPPNGNGLRQGGARHGRPGRARAW